MTDRKDEEGRVREILERLYRSKGQAEEVFINEALADILAWHAEQMEKELPSELDDIYCELRGLLREHSQFPGYWNTEKELKRWLKKRGQY